jgi:hypothetical protein
MATPAQRYLSNLFNLETDKSRNDKLISLSSRDTKRIYSHLSKSNNWIARKRRGMFQDFYNPTLDVRFSISFTDVLGHTDRTIPNIIVSKRDILNNKVLDLITFSW